MPICASNTQFAGIIPSINAEDSHINELWYLAFTLKLNFSESSVEPIENLVLTLGVLNPVSKSGSTLVLSRSA